MTVIYGTTAKAMAEENLRTAEGLTKFLRSKGTSIDDIVSVSHKLLDDELHVYLPNRLTFVFELLINRLNDSKQPQFKSNLSVWELFNRTWTLLDNEPRARTRSFQTFRFAEAILGALADRSDSGRETAIDLLTHTFNLVSHSTHVISTQDVALNTLSTYLNHLAHIDSDNSERVKDICAFFKASLPEEKYTAKLTSAFVTTALPSILRLLDANNTNTQPLVTLVKKTVISKELITNLKETLLLLLKQDIGAASSSHFFKLIVDTIPKNDTSALEDIYVTITERYPDSSDEQLKYLSDTKRVLSSSFIQMVFDIEFSKPQQNWNMIQSLLKLDIEVGVSQGEKIMKELAQQQSDNFLEIGKDIIDAHIRARDLGTFFIIWMGLIENKSSIWAKPEFHDVVSKSIITFSASQLLTLIETIQASESSAKNAVLSTIVQGLFIVKDKNVKTTAKTVLASMFSIQRHEDEDIWSLRFQLLCLFEEIVTEEQVQELVSLKVKKASLNQFYTMFRIREIHEFDITPLSEQFCKYLLSTKESSSIIEAVFQRWFVLVNQLFTSTQIDLITSHLLKHQSLTIELMQNSVLFEQGKIIGSILSNISSDIGKRKEISKFDISVLKTIPIQCYPTRVKATLLDKLTEYTTSSKNPSAEVLDTLVHILQTPTFKSKVESDIKTIKKIVQIAPQSTVFETIWLHYISNIKESNAIEFTKSAIEFIQKALKKESKEVSYSFYMAFTILSTTPSSGAIDLSSLQTTFIKSSKSLLSSFLSSPNRDLSETLWLLRSIYELKLDIEDFDVLQPLLKDFGKTIQNTDETDIKACLFLLLSKFSTGAQDTEYFESLFIVLREAGVPRAAITTGLEHITARLDDQSFENSARVVLSSFSDSSRSSLLVEILYTYLQHVTRSNPHTHQLIVESLSTLLMNFSMLDSSSLTVALQAFKRLLTEKTWAFTQYSIELLLTFISRSADYLHHNTDAGSIELFTTLTQCMSNIVLFHRYRLSNRHHIVLSVFVSLLHGLTKKRTTSELQSSRVAAESYQRIVVNLCEPVQSTKERDSENLNSAASLTKKLLRKHAYVLLLSFVQLSLKAGFESAVRESLLPGMFSVFDVLSQNELTLLSTSLDYSGRVYFRTVYDEYKKVGKWRND